MRTVRGIAGLRGEGTDRCRNKLCWRIAEHLAYILASGVKEEFQDIEMLNMLWILLTIMSTVMILAPNRP